MIPQEGEHISEDRNNQPRREPLYEEEQPEVAVVVPCYKVSSHLEDVLTTIPPLVRRIIVVDDGCPHDSGRVAERLSEKDNRITVIRHSRNKGVGGAMITGYRAALETNAQIVVKMDGDGQMDPNYLGALIRPLLDGTADYAKGNRFRDFDALKQMPRIRLFGNSTLSFLVKAASGYWNIMDPTNGYTAIHRRALEKLDLEQVSEDFFFESDMLIQLNLIDAVVSDVPMKAVYRDEPSSLRIGKVLVKFPSKLMRGMARRVFLRYFVYDFNMASVYILIGLPMLVFGTLFGIVQWIDSAVSGVPKSAGTIMLAALPVILAFQMLLQAVQIDIFRTPRR